MRVTPKQSFPDGMCMHTCTYTYVYAYMHIHIHSHPKAAVRLPVKLLVKTWSSHTHTFTLTHIPEAHKLHNVSLRAFAGQITGQNVVVAVELLHGCKVGWPHTHDDN